MVEPQANQSYNQSRAASRSAAAHRRLRPPGARLVRIAVAGAACALLVLAAGRLAERVVLGANEADGARPRRSRRARRLRPHGARAAADGARRGRRRVGRRRRPGRRHRRAAAVRRGRRGRRRRGRGRRRADRLRPPTDGRWPGTDGRRSCPPDRLQGDEAWFFAQGALGLRLVYVTPGDGRRPDNASGRSPPSARSSSPARLALRRWTRSATTAARRRSRSSCGSKRHGRRPPQAPSTWRRRPARVCSPPRSTPRISPARANRWRRASVSLALIVLALGAGAADRPAARLAQPARRARRRTRSRWPLVAGADRRQPRAAAAGLAGRLVRRIRSSPARSTPLRCSARSCRRRSTSC